MIVKIALLFIIGVGFQSTLLDASFGISGYGSSFHECCKYQDEAECDCRIYCIFCDQNASYHSYYDVAKNLCLLHYDGLARIENANQHNDIIHYIKERNLDDESCIEHQGFWIGLDDRDVEGHFVWESDTVKDGYCYEDGSDYNCWARNEPNNNVKENADGQDCGQLWFKKGGKCDDEYCDFRPKGAICEIRVPHCDFDAYEFPDVLGVDTLPYCGSV